MKKFIFTTIFTTAMLMNTAAVYAQSKMAVVDIRMLLSESKAAKSIQSQIKSRRDKFVDELAKEEKTLRDMEKNLIEKQKELSQEEFGKKRQEFEKKLIETRKSAAEKRRSIEEGAGKASLKLREEITKIVQKMADENEFDLVLSMQNVIVGNNALNITEDVKKALNKETPKISVKF